MSKLSYSLVSAVALGALLMACGESSSNPPIVPSGGSANPGAGGAPVTGAGGAQPGAGGDAVPGAGGDAVPGAGGDEAGTGGDAPVVEGVPLAFTDGWIEADANTLGVQGAVFAYADPHTETGDGVGPEMVTVIEGPTACIKGEAFKVDTKCDTTMLTPPAMDCYGEYWGAAIGFNLNQPKVPDPDNPEEEIGGDPEPFDLSGKVSAFSFKITGATIPTSLRFSVDSGEGDAVTQYCTTSMTKIVPDANGVVTVKLDDLRSECWLGTAFSDPQNRADLTKIVKIAWGVVTNDKSAVPFDFCVSEVIAVP